MNLNNYLKLIVGRIELMISQEYHFNSLLKQLLGFGLVFSLKLFGWFRIKLLISSIAFMNINRIVVRSLSYLIIMKL